MKLSIYNAIGQRIKVLVDDKMNPGFYSVVWDGRDDIGKVLASGVYFYRMEIVGFPQTRKLILMR